MNIESTVGDDGICRISIGDEKIVGGRQSARMKDIVRNTLNGQDRLFMINMVDVEWLTPSGIGIFISMLKTIREAGGRLALYAVHDKVTSLLTVTKLITVFDLFVTEVEAKAFLLE